MQKLSAVIITKNEARNIGRCLASLQSVADEIIVADSGSEDRTREICEASDNVRFMPVEWQGYARTKNAANAAATYDLILSLDADEALTPELAEAVNRAKTDAPADNLAYSLNRLTVYCGREIRHSGWFPDVKVRLFDRRRAEWRGDYVHERLVLTGGQRVTKLNGLCMHYSFYSIAQHLQQIDKFTDLAAREMLAEGKRGAYFKMLLSPVVMFLKAFIFKGGFRDGFYGYVIARNSAHARFLRYAKLISLRRQKTTDAPR